MSQLNTSFTAQSTTPFAHFRVDDLLSENLAARVLDWLRNDAPWQLVIEEFYEQYEFSLLSSPLPEDLNFLTSPDFIASIESLLSAGLTYMGKITMVEIAAHKLVPGQTIRVHNDFIGEEETHRMLIQVNEGWDADKGGLLMLFNSRRPEDIADIVVPDHNSGFGFEISPQSFHAVSTIHNGERFTLVYTFRRAQ
ncbi:cyclophane-containing peptide 2OG-Fe(II) oxygenase YhhC [Asticcacaulis benevestitus]|uniref:Prolyl 3,4-dihydroxylase TPA1/OFD1 N-terminal domain-containing protein n=1 Tax=Asticcacaulis benevestitus DSM 16100 = ATCC BAA-896 TaxID=1121022 RepID=V4PYJ1_9CAUL|nr:cyclophane-containing peptide 2OG-Fe(II) oxygenase YhhC [Asticcacaulis benevestitus]ESQ92509.1 hypothetical protein ABENE_07690 [Asticcacaulis benevestitus DSM 16100 = ATCC BAA-896]